MALNDKVIEQTFLMPQESTVKRRYCSLRAAATFFWRCSTPSRGDNRGKVFCKTRQCPHKIQIFFSFNVLSLLLLKILIRWSWTL